MGGTAAYGIWRVILASAVGTMIEWYDFYIFGSLAAVLSPLFYPPGNQTFAYIAYLATFAVGFVVRPFGALFFGRIGDLVGRKYAFLVTLSIMGGATAIIGMLPTFRTAGWFAPICLLGIRILQGLALGGEYGGATVYVAEHVPDHKRGFYTSFIQITATLGLFISLIVILATQSSMSREAFSAWGWRIPFLISIFMLAISLYIRLRMKESPIFTSIKTAGMTSLQPLRDAFGKWENLKRVLISLFGATAGQGVVWYCGQFCSFLHADHSQGESHAGEQNRGFSGAARNAVLHCVWSPVRPHRTKKNHHGRLLDRRRYLYPALQSHAASRRKQYRIAMVHAQCANGRN